MRHPALSFHPASQETCHSLAAALSLRTLNPPTLRASTIARLRFVQRNRREGARQPGAGEVHRNASESHGLRNIAGLA